MSNLGVSFRIDAITEGFTKGMAKVNNAIKDTKKGLREFDVGNGLKQALGIGGIIQGFRSVINHAQEIRDNLEKLGKPVDEATRSVAAYGDALDSLKTGVAEFAITSLSFFTRAGEGWGMLINRMRGVSAEQERIAEGAAKGADEQEAALSKLIAKRTIEAETIDKQVADQKRANEMGGMSTEEKRNKLLAEREKILSEIDAMPEYDESTQTGKIHNVARKQKQLAADKLTGEIGGMGRELQKDAEEKQRQDADKKKQEDEKRRKLSGKFGPSVEELAGTELGGFFDGNDPRLKARKVLETEAQAKDAFGRMDFKGGMELAGKAQGLRSALEDQMAGVKPSAAKEPPTAAQMDDLIKAVQGVIRAQP